MTPSKIFFYLCFSFISGVFIGSIIFIPQFYSLGFLFFGIMLIFIPLLLELIIQRIYQQASGRLFGWFSDFSVRFRVAGFCVLFLVLGISRYQIAEFKILDSRLKKYNDLEKEITLIGIIIEEPDIRENSQKLTIKIKEIQTNESVYGSMGEESGKVLATINRYPEYQYGDKIEIIGKLATPLAFEGFDYQNYLGKKGIYSVMSRPEVKLLERGRGNLVYAEILQFKNKLRESIYQNLSPPQSLILGAMLLGDKRKISEEWKEKLNITGLRHITAVSGMHVVILAGVLMAFLMGLGFWRGQAFYLTMIFIWLFIIMIGFQSSGIRAGIMGGLFLLGQKFGRLSVGSRAIVMAAAAMLLVNPLLLMFDVGFQLSFLAALGIIYLDPIFKIWLKFIPEEKFLNLRSVISITLSAQIFTLPILIYNFGRISIVAPLANILIIPAIHWIMISGFIFGLLGMIWQTLGWLSSFPCWFLLTYLIKITDFFSKLSFSSKTIENINWIWLIIFYLLLGFFVKWFRKRIRLKFLEY